MLTPMGITSGHTSAGVTQLLPAPGKEMEKLFGLQPVSQNGKSAQFGSNPLDVKHQQTLQMNDRKVL